MRNKRDILVNFVKIFKKKIVPKKKIINIVVV